MRFKEADRQEGDMFYRIKRFNINFQVGNEFSINLTILSLEAEYLQSRISKLLLIADGEYLLFIRLYHSGKDK